MTILIGWLGVDSHSPCSAYLMSDSRFTWDGQHNSYDYGQKLFAFKSCPDILGYCGEVLFASQTLSQLVNAGDAGTLFPASADSSERSRIIFNQIKTQFANFPTFARGPSSIFHFSKDNANTFHVYCYKYSPSYGTWSSEELAVDTTKSSLIFAEGSGAHEFKRLYSKYQTGDIANTSRNIFQCFCQSLMCSNIPSCGGSPQLVGLYRGPKFNGIPFGIVYNHTRYLLGSPSPELPDYNSVRWYNENFEICDGNSMERLPSAMRQPNPNI
ncbi:MAG: hypothetical protein E7549_03125 [Ruminococcaceae bacterium]|nr:hypothetical protein [Oscillospiraceae bacterium]